MLKSMDVISGPRFSYSTVTQNSIQVQGKTRWKYFLQLRLQKVHLLLYTKQESLSAFVLSIRPKSKARMLRD